MLYIESQVAEAITQGKKSINRIFIWFFILLPILVIGIVFLPNKALGIYTSLFNITLIFTGIGVAFWLGKYKERRWKRWVTESFQDPSVLYLIERRAIENGWGMFDNLASLKNPKQATAHIQPPANLPAKTVFDKNKRKIKLHFALAFANWLLCLLVTVGLSYFIKSKEEELFFYAIIINLVVAGFTIFVSVRLYRIYKSPQNLLEISAQGIWSTSTKKLEVISWEHIRQFAFPSPTTHQTNYSIYLMLTPAYAQSIGKTTLSIDIQLAKLPKDKQNLENLFNQYQYLYWHKTPISDE